MMSLTVVIGVVLLIGAIVGVVVAVRMTRPKVTCPLCDSVNVREAGRDSAGISTYQRFSGSHSGATETMVRSHTKIKYMCEKCGKNFEKTVTETR